jgi:hypothetical protein
MDLIKKDQKIALYFQKDNSMIEMTCIIKEVLDDRLVLEPPQYFMRYVDALQVGCNLTAKVFSKLGTVDFNTMVISSPLEDAFEIELDYNSLKLTENSEIPVISAVENLEIKSDSGTYKVKTFELSTEFFKFYSDKDFSVNDKLDFILYLPKDYGIIKFKGIVTDIDPIYDNEYTASYLTISEEDRQLLLYYMYMYSTDVV